MRILISSLLLFFFLSVQAQQTLTLGSALYFSQSGTLPDGYPAARLVENWGIRFNSPDPRWVFSSKPSVLIGYQPNGTDWGNDNLYVAGNVGIGTTAPSGFLEIKGPYTGNSQLIINTTGSAGELRFSDNGVPKGFVWYNQGADYMAFGRGSVANSMFVKPNGDFGIGTTTPDSKLTVKGNIHAQEVKVDLNGAVAPDYVFQKDYPLTPLSELKTYIDQNKHLPEIPSAKEMEEKGINLKEMNLKLLQKIEELTLHIINQEQRILQLEKDKKEQ